MKSSYMRKVIITLYDVCRCGEFSGSCVSCVVLVREKTKGVSEVRWLKGVMSSGTLGDKMASLTLLVQESPVHSLSAINGLLAMAAKKGKRECILATGKEFTVQ